MVLHRALLTAHAVYMSSTPTDTACHDFCKHPCAELTGNPAQECGTCESPMYECRPGALGFGDRLPPRASAELPPTSPEASASLAHEAQLKRAAELAKLSQGADGHCFALLDDARLGLEGRAERQWVSDRLYHPFSRRNMSELSVIFEHEDVRVRWKALLVMHCLMASRTRTLAMDASRRELLLNLIKLCQQGIPGTLPTEHEPAAASRQGRSPRARA